MKISIRITYLLFCLLFTISGCHYVTFIEYLRSKEGFKKFDEKVKLAGDNSRADRAMKIHSYDWDVEVFPSKKRIAGTMTITFSPTLEGRIFLFDMQRKLKLLDYESSFGNPTVGRKGDLMLVEFDQSIPAGKRISLTFSYKGKPVNVDGQGPIQWKKDEKDRDWISTLTQGIGPHFMMPCVALLNKEPDSTHIKVTVPAPLKVASNGSLISQNYNEGFNTNTFEFLVTNPMNIYSLSFNIGHFSRFEKKYTDILGIERTLRFAVLDYHEAKADSFYDQTPEILATLENLYGPFPFWEDGCKMIESTFGAMEHQSGIAMGTPYNNKWRNHNLTLIHELSHEWWGNNITGNDYCDAWMHEGLATFSEALVLEQLYGRSEYEKRLIGMVKSTKNKFPVLKPCDVLYNSWVNNADGDIYSKGGLFMHSLRQVIDNDALFFELLKSFQQEFPRSNLSTQEFADFCSNFVGKDLWPVFEWYLTRTSPPELVVRKEKEKGGILYKWKEEPNFYKDGTVAFLSSGDTLRINPTEEFQFLPIQKDSTATMLASEGIYFTFGVEN